MKYRDHSLRYINRNTKRPAPRPSERPAQPATTAPPQQLEHDDTFVHRHHNHDEPLIDVHDTESKFQKIKDGFGTAAHAGAYIANTHLMPKAKQHAIKASTHVRSSAAHVAPRLASHIRRASPKWLSLKLITIIVVFVAGYFLATRINPPHTASTAQTATTGQTQPVGGTSPAYDTLLPEGVSIEKLGGWKRVSPPTSNPVFAYADTLDRIQISVSQQPLPRDFSTDPDKEIKDLASGFNANDRHVADDATVYFLGTSSKGPQSVILAKENVLILIKAPAQIKVESWSKYIATLQ